MPISPEFLPMMQDTITLRAQASLDKYAKPTYASGASTFRARLIWDERIIRDSEGREIVEAGRAILYGSASAVTPQWLITLPDGSTPKITSVSTIKDEDGNHHSVIGFGQG